MIALAIKGVLLRYVTNTVSVRFYSNSFRQIKAREICLRPEKFTKISGSGDIQTLTDNFYFLLKRKRLIFWNSKGSHWRKRKHVVSL